MKFAGKKNGKILNISQKVANFEVRSRLLFIVQTSTRNPFNAREVSFYFYVAMPIIKLTWKKIVENLKKKTKNLQKAQKVANIETLYFDYDLSYRRLLGIVLTGVKSASFF